MSLSVKNISKSYGKQRVLNKVSFSLKEGEITGFLGPNGAGKTTTMGIISGYLHDWTGIVEIYGKNIKESPLRQKKILGYLPEHNPLDEQLYVREYLSYVAHFYLPKSEISRATRNIIEQLGLGNEQHKKIGVLSKGYKQRVGLAQALIHQPKILILDEPTTGLDPNQLEYIRKFIREIGKDKTVLLSTHIMQEVEAMCERILIINKGAIVADKQTALQDSNYQKIKVQFNKEVYFHSLDFVLRTTDLGNNTYLIESSSEKDIRPLLFDFAVINNCKIIHLSEEKNTLEDTFRKVTE